MSTTLLHRLRENQVALDLKGPLEADTGDERFRLAMTLRDVTVYLRFPIGDEKDLSVWEARLGDLDMKSGDKGEVWKEKERELIDGGWYEGSESTEDRQPLGTCYVSIEG